MIDINTVLASSDDEEDDELGNSDIREVYKQHQNNMRAFAVLRFRHFTTFAVLMAFIATISVQSLSGMREQQYASGVGFIIILLFWTLDFRSGEYLKYHAGVAAELERTFLKLEKRVDFSLPSFPARTWLSASRTTNLIFLTILVAWMGFALSLPHNRSNDASPAKKTERSGNAESANIDGINQTQSPETKRALPDNQRPTTNESGPKK